MKLMPNLNLNHRRHHQKWRISFVCVFDVLAPVFWPHYCCWYCSMSWTMCLVLILFVMDSIRRHCQIHHRHFHLNQPHHHYHQLCQNTSEIMFTFDLEHKKQIHLKFSCILFFRSCKRSEKCLFRIEKYRLQLDAIFVNQ